MSLPADGVNANALAETTTIPTGKKLIFLDPDTNEGGIITLENLTKQILSNLATQTFNLDQGTKTLLAALNELNSKGPFGHTYRATNTQNIEIDISKVKNDNASIPFLVTLCDWTTGECFAISGIYRGKSERQIPHIISDSLGECEVSYETGVLKISLSRSISYVLVYY